MSEIFENAILALDTSNYTTSAALFCGGKILQSRIQLPVEKGKRGLRQSDAVFLHTKQLPLTVGALPQARSFCAVACSDRPRDAENSYMPCFTVGSSFARSFARLENIPLYRFSHQSGHIAAALYSAGRLDMFAEEFLAFHFSGGTLECVLVRPDPERVIRVELLGGTSDLSAGQIIDRVGVMMGLNFPSGPQMEQLALTCGLDFPVKPCVKGNHVCMSGLENKCRQMYSGGATAEETSKFCLQNVGASLAAFVKAMSGSHPGMKKVFCGGVASNSIVKGFLADEDSVFAQPSLCTDNALGIAVLAAKTEGML